MKQRGGVIPIGALVPGLRAVGKTKQRMKKKNKRKAQKGKGLK